MTKVCTHGRDADVAMQQLEESLRRLGTDHLDLWQVHECVYDNDPERHFAPGGVIEALDRAKQQGKVRFVGFTGHKDPDIHLEMLAHGYPFDTVQMPLNCFDASFRSFEQRVLPEVATAGGSPRIGMKSLGGSGHAVRRRASSRADEALRYAMSLPVATTVSGIDSLDVLRQNLAIARGFTPMTPAEMDALRARVAGYAADGHFELYKTTMHFDAKVGASSTASPQTRAELPLVCSTAARPIPRRTLGKTGVEVSALGMGGHHLGELPERRRRRRDLVHEAIDAGITFFDNCWEYHNGRSEDWLGRALAAAGATRSS